MFFQFLPVIQEVALEMKILKWIPITTHRAMYVSDHGLIVADQGAWLISDLDYYLDVYLGTAKLQNRLSIFKNDQEKSINHKTTWLRVCEL